MGDRSLDRPLRVVVITGIYPPDIGGPATHVADIAEELTHRGLRVMVLTLGDGRSVVRDRGLVRLPRRWPWPLRHLALSAWLIAHRHEYDVVYTAGGLHPGAVAAGRIVRRPVVVKVVGDAAWERGTRTALVSSEFEDFQRQRRVPVSVLAMRWLQRWSLRKARAITAPSAYLAGVVESWLGGPSDVAVMRNGVRVPEIAAHRKRRAPTLQGLFVGRLVRHKRVDRLIQAVALTDGVQLTIIGDGPERPHLEALTRDLKVEHKVGLTSALGHDEVMERLSEADLLLLNSEYEGLPHAAIEALACGTPIVTIPVGGVSEVVREGENGLLVHQSSAEAISRALALLRDNPQLLEKLSEGARRDGTQWRIENSVDEIEGLLRRVSRRKPRAVFIGKARVSMPLTGDFERKLRVLQRHLDPILVSVGRPGVWHFGTIRVVAFPNLRPALLGGVLFYLLGPVTAVGLAVGRGQTTIVCQSPYEGIGTMLVARVLPRRIRPPVVVEVHGDWTSASRLYGSTLRRFFAPMSDRLAEWSVRNADRVRVIGDYTESLVRRLRPEGPIDRFITFSDFSTFLEDPPEPLPEDRQVAFVGVLDRHKGVDILMDAWAQVVREHPQARLLLAGDGALRGAVDRRIREGGLDSRVRLLGHQPRPRVKELLDRSRMLVLPSRSEGLGRVVLEAFARGRPVVATRVGGIPELVSDGTTGLLVPVGESRSLADAILSLLDDDERLKAMGAEALRSVSERDPAKDFETGIERLAAWIELQ